MSWGNWAIVADLGTALGTLILAVATFSAVKSANLTARVAQQSQPDDPGHLRCDFGDLASGGLRGKFGYL